MDFVATGKLEKRHTVDHICMDDALASQLVNVDAWETTVRTG